MIDFVTTHLGFVLFGLAVLSVGLITRRFGAARAQLTQKIAALSEQNAVLQRRVDYDILTPARSRQYLAERVDDPNRDTVLALIFVDLDRFKSVNDGHGHDVGDRLLVEIAARIETMLGPDDFVARLGGDEFCVLLKDADLDNAIGFAERMGTAIANTSIHSGGLDVSRSASIGVGQVLKGQKLIDALIIVDGALRHAKSRGRNRVQLADETVLESLAAQRAKPSIEQLKTGLDRGEVIYHVQPIFNLRSGMVTGVEALIRWQLPNGTLRRPEDFLETMTGSYHLALKPPLEAANKAAQTFARLHPQMFVAFNISSSFLERSEDIDSAWIERLLNGIPPHQMVFEIIESAVIANPAGAHRMVSALRDAGLKVALDDFGTGQSNLSRLREYPVDIVKIDRQFLSSIGEENDRNMGILLGLTEMASTMGFDIIAEGIENERQLEAIEGLGIDLGQGFLLGRPGPVDTWIERLERDPSFRTSNWSRITTA